MPNFIHIVGPDIDVKLLLSDELSFGTAKHLIDVVSRGVCGKKNAGLTKTAPASIVAKVRRATPADILVLGGTRGVKGRMADIIDVFERLEVKHGIGCVSRHHLRVALLKKSSLPEWIGKQGIRMAIDGGYLKVHNG